MKLNRKLCASWMLWHQGALLRRGARRKFLDALAPRRAVKARKKPASWLDDSFGMLSAYMLMSFYNFLDALAPRRAVKARNHERSEFTSILTSYLTSES